VSQGFGGAQGSSGFSCTCICITNHFFPLTDTAASASAILLQRSTKLLDSCATVQLVVFMLLVMVYVCSMGVLPW
jgi:hypothetical protein